MCTETIIEFGSHTVKTLFVSDEGSVEFALKYLWKSMEDKRVVGLGIEKTFKSMPNTVISEKVAALKLACRGCCIIIPLLYFTTIPTSLPCFLNLPDVTFVGFGIKDSLFKLQRDYGLECMNGVDLGQFSAKAFDKEHLSSSGLAILARYFSYEIDWIGKKPPNVCLLDWAGSDLTKDKIKEATISTYASFLVGSRPSGLAF